VSGPTYIPQNAGSKKMKCEEISERARPPGRDRSGWWKAERGSLGSRSEEKSTRWTGLASGIAVESPELLLAARRLEQRARPRPEPG